MPNFLSYYKKNNPNIYSLLVSVLLAVWYNGISGLLNYYWPSRGPTLSIIFLCIPLIVFLTDDGHLDELYRPPTSYKVDNQSGNITAIMASATPSYDQIRRERFK